MQQERVQYFQATTEDGQSITTEFHWNEADPFAVRAIFHTRPDRREWVFAVDLLRGGFGPFGDVAVTNAGKDRFLTLFPRTPQASSLTFPGREVDSYLGRIPTVSDSLVEDALQVFLDSLFSL